jgi:multidrug efflux pump subunit AcrA (membrane-fusion protein)
VVLVIAASLGLPALRERPAIGGSADLPVFEVRRELFVRQVWADGNLEAVEATVLSPPPTVRNPLRIGWLAPDGSRVREGEVVIRFDPTDLEKKLEQGQHLQATTDSRITQTDVREESAVRNLGRDAEMATMDLEYAREFQSKDEQIFSRIEIIESEIDEQLATRKKAHAEAVQEIRGELSQVELDLLAIERRKADLQVEEAVTEMQQLEVRAPHDGIFVLKNPWGGVPEVGEMVWGGNQVGEIPRLEQMQAKVFVLEADAGGLQPGISATVELDSLPGRVFNATVKQVDALAQPRTWRVPVQYFGVVLELERTESEVMKPGQRVQATLILDELEDVLTVPRQAVFEGDEGSLVYVARGGGFEPVPVELGAAGLGRVVIESGVVEGDRVALRDPTLPLSGVEEEHRDGENGPVNGSAGGDS